MLKKILTLGPLAVALSFSATAHSQAMPTAVAKGGLQVGVGWSDFRSDYGPHSVQGITGFGDYDLRPHFGLEAEYHYLSLITPTDRAENTFLIGPRFILPRNRFSLYAKAGVGIGNIKIQELDDNTEGGAGTFFAYAIGGGIDYRLSRHFVARADYEYQRWSYYNGLTPSGVTVGVAYRFR